MRPASPPYKVVANATLPWLPATAVLQLTPTALLGPLRSMLFLGATVAGAALCTNGARMALQRANEQRRADAEEAAVFAAALGKLAAPSEEADDESSDAMEAGALGGADAGQGLADKILFQSRVESKSLLNNSINEGF